MAVDDGRATARMSTERFLLLMATAVIGLGAGTVALGLFTADDGLDWYVLLALIIAGYAFGSGGWLLRLRAIAPARRPALLKVTRIVTTTAIGALVISLTLVNILYRTTEMFEVFGACAIVTWTAVLSSTFRIEGDQRQPG